MATSQTDELSNYILQIDLLGVSNPNITRTLSVPASTTFHTLHCAIQVAFDWKNAHLHHFTIFGAPPTTTSLALDPVLLKLEPKPRPDDLDGTMSKDSKKWKLRDVFENDEYKNFKRIEYLYDFGDDWEHSIALIGRANTSTSSIVCLSGEGGPAAEDCGGPYGWEELKSVYEEHQGEEEDECDDPSEHERMDWYEGHCLNGSVEGLLPGAWDKEAINKELAAKKGLMARIAGAAG
jgi:hypothetical protein